MLPPANRPAPPNASMRELLLTAVAAFVHVRVSAGDSPCS